MTAERETLTYETFGTAVVHEKPQSVVSCDYAWRRTDRWIDFPWSTLPPVVRRSDRPTH